MVVALHSLSAILFQEYTVYSGKSWTDIRREEHIRHTEPVVLALLVNGLLQFKGMLLSHVV